MRSLRDLDAEWEAGDIDAADYRALKDAYTARAAAALHALDGRAAAANRRLAPRFQSDAGSEDGDEPGSGTAGDPGELDDEPGVPEDEPGEPDATRARPKTRPARPDGARAVPAGAPS